MGKLHIGEISELSNKVCKLDEQVNNFKDRIIELEGEKFFLITEDEFDALTPEQKAEKNYAVIEE